MKRAFSGMAVAAAVLVWATVAHGQVTLTQTVKLNYGWNAVYLEVAPLTTLAETFADWPVDKVGLYDPAAFLPMRQFGDGAGDSLGITLNPIATWYRDYPEASDAEVLPPGTVALAFSTNKSATTLRIRGVPAAPRTTWHVTGAKDPYNCMGVSLQKGATTTAPDYLEGFPGSQRQEYYRFSGKRTNAAPTLAFIYPTTPISDGEVLLVASDRISDWSGTLFVSPMNGLDFGQNGTLAALEVRNDGAAARMAAVDLLRPGDVGETGVWGKFALPDAAVKVRDVSPGETNLAWRAAVEGGSARRVAEKRLEPGEKLRLEFGLDRTALPTAVKGDDFGALLRVTDADGASKMRADVPLVGQATGLDAEQTAWPAGLWVADVAFDHVLPPGETVETETGGTAKIRLPIHIDTNGTIRLLQRVVAAGTADSEGTWTYRLYAGAANIPETASQTLRLSAVTLPTETPVIEAESGSGFISGDVAFAFTVAENGATSILRHRLHPQHDGLRWDFSTSAPSGDQFENYMGDVKPETFSVTCRIELMFALDGGEAEWNPEGAKAGTCKWAFSNLMRQGDIVLSGPMVIKRVSPIGEIVLK
jgi:hypothetical protein